MPENATKATSEIQPFTFELPAYLQAVDRLLQDGRYRNLSPRTLAFYEYHLSGFQRFLLVKDEPLTASSFIPFVRLMVKEMCDGGLAQDTIAGRIRSCRRFFRFLYPDQKWMPLQLLRMPNQKTFTGLRDYTIMIVMLETGIRIGGTACAKAKGY